MILTIRLSVATQDEILTAAKSLAAAGVLEKCKSKKKKVPVPPPGPRITRSTARQQAADGSTSNSCYPVTIEEVDDEEDNTPSGNISEMESESPVHDDKVIDMKHLFLDSEYKCTCGKNGKSCRCYLGATFYGVWNQAGHPVSSCFIPHRSSSS